MSSALALTIRTSIITTPTSTEYGEPNKPTDYRRVSSDWRHLVNEYDEATSRTTCDLDGRTDGTSKARDVFTFCVSYT